MSQVEEWLHANKDRLAEIASRSDTSEDLVHLAAVLVLAGLSDAQIREQLASVESRFYNDDRYIRHLLKALPQIRSIAVDPDSPDTVGPRARSMPNARHPVLP
jgi:hypothetical protein